MTPEERRAKISDILEKTSEPITGSALSTRFAVTRQVIVGDVAVLRARGVQIIATPQGYILPKDSQPGAYKSTLAVRHGRDQKALVAELNLIVDLGGKINDVTVEHPLYGEITANLQLASRADVEQFVIKMDQLQAEPLSTLTDGYHLHTIEAPNKDVLEAIRKALRKKGYLAE